MNLNTKILITFNYLDYILLKKNKTEGNRLLYIPMPFYLKLNIDYKNFKINKYNLKPKRYKLDNIFSDLIGFKEFYIVVNNKTDIFKGYILKKFILKFVNNNAIVLGIDFKNSCVQINNLINNSFDFEKKIFVKELITNITEKFLTIFISSLSKNILGKNIFFNYSTLKILKFIDNKKYVKNNKWFFNKVYKKKINTNFNIEQCLMIDNVYKIFKITYPFLSKKEIYQSFKKIFQNEEIIKLNNLYIPKNYINTKKYKSKNKFVANMFNIVKILYNNKNNLVVEELQLLYNNKKVEKTFEYYNIKFKNSEVEKEIEKLNINLYEINYFINKKYILNIIKETKNTLDINEIFSFKLSFQELINAFEYLQRKKLLYSNDIIYKLNNNSKILLEEFHKYKIFELLDKIQLKIDNLNNKNILIEDVINYINKIINDNTKILEKISSKPSVKQINKIKILHKNEKIDINKNIEELSKTEIEDILNNYYKKQLPTEKQINLIQSIFVNDKEVSKNFNLNEILKNKKISQTFIFKYFYNKPSKKQLELIEKIEKKYSIKISKEIKENKFLLNNFLKEFI